MSKQLPVQGNATASTYFAIAPSFTNTIHYLLFTR